MAVENQECEIRVASDEDVFTKTVIKETHSLLEKTETVEFTLAVTNDIANNISVTNDVEDIKTVTLKLKLYDVDDRSEADEGNFNDWKNLGSRLESLKGNIKVGEPNKNVNI